MIFAHASLAYNWTLRATRYLNFLYLHKFSTLSLFSHLLQIEGLGDSWLHLNRLLVHQVEINLALSSVVVDCLLVLDKSSQMLDVGLQKNLDGGNIAKGNTDLVVGSMI